jgi:two-component system, NtrC family, nitrogen regulation sensor histidine kinase NtrY
MRQPPSPEQERRKRRRELFVALAGALVIGLIFLVESRVARSSEHIPFAGYLFLFSLLSVVTLLLILVIFFLIRNLFKLVFERRGRVPGAQIKTRLTLAFVALTLVPTVVLFIASAGVLHTTIESWFTAQVEDSLQSSLVVAQAYYQNASEKVQNLGMRVAAEITAESLLDPNRRDELNHTLESWRAAESMDSLQVHFRDGSPAIVASDPSLRDMVLPAPRPSLLKIALRGKKTSSLISLDDGSDLVRGVTPIRDRHGDAMDAVLVVDNRIPMSLAGRLFSISSAWGDYQEAKRMKGPVKTVYILILLMVALLVVFIGFWFGISIARDITDPILSLAEGTQKIAGGDLDVYIEPVGDDELSVLVRSFNTMTGDLRSSRDELIRANQDIEGRRKYMETVLKNIAAGVLALDAERRITAVNNSARRLLGIVGADVLNRPIDDVLPEVSAQPTTEMLDTLSGSRGDSLARQVTLSFPERVTSLLCFANRLADDDGRHLGAVLVFEDMTYLIKAQRMAAWREVARRIAHEIKNPLTPIQLNAQRLRRKYMDKLGGDTEVLDQCTGVIIDQVEQLKNMVNEFSKFARMPSANPVPGCLNTVIREVVQLYAQANEGISFRFLPDERLPIFDFDREQMKRATVNLLDNAVSATGNGGEVRVLTAYDPELAMATLEVSDTGPGIDSRDQDRVFEPYFSRKPGGTGLGLTIVSTIVSDHNGFVRVKPSDGGGASFVIELPVGSR